MDANRTELIYDNTTNLTHMVSDTSRNKDTMTAATAVLFYGLPIIGCLGALGNITSFGIMVSKTMRMTSFAVYMAALAVMDTVNLAHLLSGLYFTSILKMDQPGLFYYCNFKQWYNAGSFTAGAWVIIAMTCERLLALYRPLESRAVLTAKRAIKVVSAVISAAYIICIIPLFVYPSAECNSKTVRPVVSWPSYVEFGNFIQLSITYILGPSLALVCLNAAILCKLKRHNDLNSTGSVTSLKYMETGRLVIIVSVLYAALTIPYVTYLMYYRFKGLSMKRYRMSHLGPAVATLAMVLNHSINFFVYVAMSPTFRAKIVQMIPGRRHVRETGHISTTSVTENTACSSIELRTFGSLN